jgi:UDP-glucose 4-epimerase
MNLLVTGAAGCIGRQLVKKLILDKSLTVYATDIKPSPFEPAENLHYQCLDLRAEAFTTWLHEIKPNRVIHLASILQLSSSITRDIAYEIDVAATKKLLSTSVEIGVDKFVVTTSGAAYGYYPENRDMITEDRPTRGNANYFYSAHKAEVEQIMADYRKSHPYMQQIVFRPGAILGDDFDGPVVALFEQKFITGIIGSPSPFNFIWADDVVDYLIEGVFSDITGQFNIAGEGALSMKEIAQQLNKFYLALPSWLIQIALAIAKPLGLTQFGPEQVKFIKYRPVLSNTKLKTTFNHQARYTTLQALSAFLRCKKEG